MLKHKKTQAERRTLLREYVAACDKIAEAYERALALTDTYIPRPSFPPFPEELRGLTCGAKTRAGTPCKRKDLYRSGRCPLHGGLSTGPTSEEGKQRVAKNACRNKAHEK